MQRSTSSSSLGLGAFCSVLVLAASATAQTMVNQHVTSAGAQANFHANNDRPSLSDDDRYVAYSSSATNLVAGDTNANEDVFVHDNLTGATVLISRNTVGAPSNGSSRRPWLSSTGRYVVYQSNASDLVAGVAGVHVYRHDRDTDGDGIFDEPGATAMIVVSVSSAGVLGDGFSRTYTNSVSDDGDRIVFESTSTNLVAGDTNATEDCFLRIVSAGTTSRVSVSTAGAQADSTSQYPGISGDGSTVVFMSIATNLVPGDTNGAYDVFVRVVASATTSRVSLTSTGGQSNGVSLWPAISDDGQRIAFESNATNLVAGDTNAATDVFVRDRVAATTTRVSVATGGAQSGGGVDPHISGDGGFVSFASAAADLVPGDTNGEGDVFVHRLATVDTVRASRAVAGTQSDGYSSDASVSDDGSHVAFRSFATTLVAGDVNGFSDIFLRGAPFLGPETPTGMSGAEETAVTFSVNGPVDPHTDGIRYARGTPPTPQIPLQPGNPVGHCIRAPVVPQADGIDSLWPGDVFDYDVGFMPSEAVMFQSPPFPPLALDPPLGPDGTDNQILEAMAQGLIAGPGVPPGLWTTLPPMAPSRDNIDAFSFGEDYFPPMMVLGYSIDPPLPVPPPLPVASAWTTRVSAYAEPIVLDDGTGVSFRFSADPWAIGLAGTAQAMESTGADAGALCAGWMSPGESAGDVLGTPVLMRAAGATLGGGTNALVHDEETLALLGPAAPMTAMEDDLDALECVGDNSVPWFAPVFFLRPGDLHSRVMHVGPPGPPPPGLSAHDVMNDAPVFFSVTRNSVGEPGSAVRSQFVVDGGAAADIFVSAKNPADPAGDGFNLLFIDEAEIGLYAASAPPVGPAPADWTDDLDALVLWVCPEYRATVSATIDSLMMAAASGSPLWTPYGTGDANIGPGMTFSITKYIPPPPGCVRIGFSVTTDSIGAEYTAVDWEAGPVAPLGGTSTAAGDVFYAEVSGAGIGPNFLWYEGADLGLDEGGWVNGISADLSDLSDNLNALDSIDMPPAPPMSAYCTPGITTNGCMALIRGVGTPSASAASPFSLVVAGAEGQRQGLLFYGVSGRAAAPWGGGTSYLCVKAPTQRTPSQSTGGTSGLCDGYMGLDWNAYVAAHPGALGVPFTAGDTVQSQGWFRDPPAPKTTNLSDALEFVIRP